MRKIPTIFERDWNGDRSRVLDVPNPKADWVFRGEGTPTIKLDGTCCLVRSGKLYKRRELKEGDIPPDGFELSDHDDETNKKVGWVPVGDGPEDRWHREAFSAAFEDGTYELLGPKVQGNPERRVTHELVRHGQVAEHSVPRDFIGLKDWFCGRDVEGLVFHHPDGRMAKIKIRDFGLTRQKKTPK